MTFTYGVILAARASGLVRSLLSMCLGLKRDPYYMVEGDEDAKVAKCECMLCKT